MVEKQRSTQGPDHPAALRNMHNLAWMLKAQGRHAEAEVLLQEAFEGQCRRLGPNHPHTLDSLAALKAAPGRHVEG